MMSDVETIVEQPVAFEAMLEAINDLSVEQLSKLALTGNTRLFKLINSGAVKAKKTKKVAAAAAAGDEEKVRKASPGLDFTRAWVAYCRWLAQQRGWKSIEKTVGKKGQASYKQVMAASVQRGDGVHIFADTGKEISPSDAMSLAKHLKDSDDETWKAYVAENPQPVSQPKVKAAKVVPVLSTEEIEAQAQAKVAAAEAKKEAAKVKRQEAAAAKKAANNAAAAAAAGYFERSLIPAIDPATGEVVLRHDETVRPDTTAESLARLPAAFEAWGAAPLDDDGSTMDEIALRVYPHVPAIRHVHSAGNSSGIVDGAASVLIANKAWSDANGVRPRARIRAIATVGSEPVIMLTAPAPASRKALAQAGMTVGDIDLWEINEAFASVVLQTMRELDIDPSRVNVNGGAIALGHPLGATGAILLGTALDELERQNKSTALITLCIGGGQGIACILERV